MQLQVNFFNWIIKWATGAHTSAGWPLVPGVSVCQCVETSGCVASLPCVSVCGCVGVWVCGCVGVYDGLSLISNSHTLTLRTSLLLLHLLNTSLIAILLIVYQNTTYDTTSRPLQILLEILLERLLKYYLLSSSHTTYDTTYDTTKILLILDLDTTYDTTYYLLKYYLLST